MKVSFFWFRRDLRLNDNTALHHALNSGMPVIPLFIFDDNILNELPADDPRVNFIYDSLLSMQSKLKQRESGILIKKGTPPKVWEELTAGYEIAQVFFNKDYEPYALRRDKEIEELLLSKGVQVKTFKDQVIFEESEVVKDDGLPYTIFTPYKNRWLTRFNPDENAPFTNTKLAHFYPLNEKFPGKNELGIKASGIEVKPYRLDVLDTYEESRNFPVKDTSYLSPHLRFGTVSIRELLNKVDPKYATFKSELIWREFFMQILFHFPKSVSRNFKPQYDGVEWRNNTQEFERWCKGETGYPLVDAGMRQLNQTGYMHNRVRMTAASFLCKHLLIDWKWGEVYFAQKLLDFELSSNVGNWQWAAGTGCDAAPYFRIFNPAMQLKKFDPEKVYVKKWVPEADKSTYQPMVDHKMARERCLNTFKKALGN